MNTPALPLSARVLVVDDDSVNREMVRRVFERRTSCEVLLAKDGEGALETALQARPDVILLDMLMPGLSGLEVLRALRERGAIMPVIMLTAVGSGEQIVEAMQAGAVITSPSRFRSRCCSSGWSACSSPPPASSTLTPSSIPPTSSALKAPSAWPSEMRSLTTTKTSSSRSQPARRPPSGVNGRGGDGAGTRRGSPGPAGASLVDAGQFHGPLSVHQAAGL